MRGRKSVVGADAAAPVDRLEFSAIVDTEGVSGIAAIEAEDLWRLRERGAGGEKRQKCYSKNG